MANPEQLALDRSGQRVMLLSLLVAVTFTSIAVLSASCLADPSVIEEYMTLTVHRASRGPDRQARGQHHLSKCPYR